MPLLAEHFLAQISRKEGKVKRFTPAVLERLAAHPWPGNVRELRNVVYRAYVMAERPTIIDECLVAETPLAPNSTAATTHDPLALQIPIGSTLDECSEGDLRDARDARWWQGADGCDARHQPEDAVQPPEGVRDG